MRVTLLGFGTVGQGLAQSLAEKRDFLQERGLSFDLVAVADSRSSVSDENGLDPVSLIERKRSTGRVGESTQSALDLIRRVDSDVVVEVTPGNPRDGEPALSHIREALQRSRHVVSANKMPLALHFAELIRMAKSGVALRYSACVGGGIPMLETGRACGEAEKVLGIEGVLNSTSNYILSRMQDDGCDYASALAEAQDQGFAEADPSLDVDGIDAAAKLVILSNDVMGKNLTLADVKRVRGVREVTRDEVRKAASRGMVIRQVAAMGQSAKVSLREVAAKSPLSVFGPINVVVFKCEDSGDRIVAGASGGGVSTSRAVLRDLVAIARGPN